MILPKLKKQVLIERQIQSDLRKQIATNVIGETNSPSTFASISASIQQQIAAKFGMNSNFADIKIEHDQTDPTKIHINVSVPILNVNHITFQDQDLIGYVAPEGRILSILCERDGNDAAGILYNHYNDMLACHRLIKLGNIDILRPTPEECETTPMMWDPVEDPDADFGSSIEAFLSYGKNMYGRVFVRTNEGWFVWDKDKTSGKLIKLGTYMVLS